MNQVLKAILSVGGVGLIAVIFFLLHWGFFYGLGVGLLLWLVSAVLTKLGK